MVLPRTMPSSGRAYCGWYQGSGLTEVVRAKSVMVTAAISMQLVPRP